MKMDKLRKPDICIYPTGHVLKRLQQELLQHERQRRDELAFHGRCRSLKYRSPAFGISPNVREAKQPMRMKNYEYDRKAVSHRSVHLASTTQSQTKGRDAKSRKRCWFLIWADLQGAVWRGQAGSAQYEIRPLEGEDFVLVQFNPFIIISPSPSLLLMAARQ